MTDESVTPLEALSERTNELVAQLLGLDEREKKLFKSLGEPMPSLMKSQKEGNNANRH